MDRRSALGKLLALPLLPFAAKPAPPEPKGPIIGETTITFPSEVVALQQFEGRLIVATKDTLYDVNFPLPAPR